MQLVLGWASLVLATCSYTAGGLAIWRRQAKPSIVTRFFWLVLAVSNLLSYQKIGAGPGIFLAISGAAGTAVILLLALRYGTLTLKPIDTIPVVGATVALSIYIFSGRPLLSLVAGLATHFISGTPTYFRVWRDYRVEDLAFWAFFFAAAICSLASVLGRPSAALIFPGYYVFFDGFMTALILISHRRQVQ